MIGALEAIKMNSPFPGDRGLEIVARCFLLVNRLLEGRIIQLCKTARVCFFFFFSKTERGEKPLPIFISFFTFRVGRIWV